MRVEYHPKTAQVAREEYERLTQGRRGFRVAYREFRERHPNFAEDAMEPEEWLERDRNPSPGFAGFEIAARGLEGLKRRGSSTQASGSPQSQTARG